MDLLTQQLLGDQCGLSAQLKYQSAISSNLQSLMASQQQNQLSYLAYPQGIQNDAGPYDSPELNRRLAKAKLYLKEKH